VKTTWTRNSLKAGILGGFRWNGASEVNHWFFQTLFLFMEQAQAVWYGSRSGHHITICWPFLAEGFVTEWWPHKFQVDSIIIHPHYLVHMGPPKNNTRAIIYCTKQSLLKEKAFPPSLVFRTVSIYILIIFSTWDRLKTAHYRSIAPNKVYLKKKHFHLLWSLGQFLSTSSLSCPHETV
jgi:hypothetical protein